MNVKEKGKSGIYTKVYGYLPKPAITKSYETTKGEINTIVFDVVYETGSIDRVTNKPITKSIRCEANSGKINQQLVAGTKIEVGGPLRVDYDKEKEKTYVSLKVAEYNID